MLQDSLQVSVCGKCTPPLTHYQTPHLGPLVAHRRHRHHPIPCVRCLKCLLRINKAQQGDSLSSYSQKSRGSPQKGRNSTFLATALLLEQLVKISRDTKGLSRVSYLCVQSVPQYFSCRIVHRVVHEAEYLFLPHGLAQGQYQPDFFKTLSQEAGGQAACHTREQ